MAAKNTKNLRPLFVIGQTSTDEKILNALLRIEAILTRIENKDKPVKEEEDEEEDPTVEFDLEIKIAHMHKKNQELVRACYAKYQVINKAIMLDFLSKRPITDLHGFGEVYASKFPPDFNADSILEEPLDNLLELTSDYTRVHKAIINARDEFDLLFL